MRVAVVSDVHGNLTAFEAVLRDLKQTSPDVVYHGGDLADGGSSPAEIVERIRDLGWKGVLGNTDEVHVRPASLEEFADKSKAPASMWTAVREMAAAARSLLGGERIAWLRTLPRLLVMESFALVHASPESAWHSPTQNASDDELAGVYSSPQKPVVVYGHTHHPFIRRVRPTNGSEMVVVNSGSVGLPYDGDPRASYVLIENSKPTIRRVEYDVQRELEVLESCGLPHVDWVRRTLLSGSPQMP